MPIDFIQPSRGAERAFDSSLKMLGEADPGFRDLSPVLGAHSVAFCSLEAISQSGGDETQWIAKLERNRIWRFFVRSKAIGFGVVEVISTSMEHDRFDFFAFREGHPIDRAVETFAKTVSWADGRKATYGLHLLKIPGLCADFYWLRRLNVLTSWPNENEIVSDWFVSIPFSLPGFNPAEAYPARVTLDLLRHETERILATVFAATLQNKSTQAPAFQVDGSFVRG